MPFDFLPQAYCIEHGVMVNTISDRFHVDAARAFAICEGPLAFCPPPNMTEEEWAFLIQQEADVEIPE